MKNPFRYGGIVGAGSFCNRRQELTDLRRAMENGDNLFVYSERRFGKTSLVQRVLSDLPIEEFRHAYIDLWPTDDESAFINAFAKGVTLAFASTPEKMLDFGKKFFASLRPIITLDNQGSPQMAFSADKGQLSDHGLDALLEVPFKAGGTSNVRVVVVLDEFQQVLEYPSDSVERRLRSAVQKQDNVAYIFLGSRKHLIQQMITERSRPLYRAGGHYPLGPIALEHWRPFILQKFEEGKKWISQECIESIHRLTQGHPFYTQHLCHAVWENASEQKWVSQSEIEQSIDLLLDREDYAFTTLWDSLAVNQRRLLEALATDQGSSQIFSSEFIERHRLKTASNVQRAVKALLQRDLIDSDERKHFILDRFFRLWLQKRLHHWFYFGERSDVAT